MIKIVANLFSVDRLIGYSANNSCYYKTTIKDKYNYNCKRIKFNSSK